LSKCQQKPGKRYFGKKKILNRYGTGQKAGTSSDEVILKDKARNFDRLE